RAQQPSDRVAAHEIADPHVGHNQNGSVPGEAVRTRIHFIVSTRPGSPTEAGCKALSRNADRLRAWAEWGKERPPTGATARHGCFWSQAGPVSSARMWSRP